MARAKEDPSEEDLSKEFIEFVGELEVPEASNTYNITGKSAAHVIAIFKSIVNREGRYGYREGKVFTFDIGKRPAVISFSLKANPGKYQPGNGVIYRTDQWNSSYRYDQRFVDELKKEYQSDTREFAQDIKRVFKNNLELLKCEKEIIQDVYFLLLFEIGRRLVKDDMRSTPKKKDFDKLRISEAITKIVKLFEKKACRFEDVCLKEGKYHCFSGEPETRGNAIKRLQLEGLQFEDITELFYEEEDEESPEDTTSRDKESSEEPVSGICKDLDDLNLSERSQNKSKKPSNKD